MKKCGYRTHSGGANTPGLVTHGGNVALTIQEYLHVRRVRTKCASNEGVATLIVSLYSKDKSGSVCGWANKHAKTSHGVSQDEGGGGGPALCNRLTPCFCWHGCLRVPGSTQTEEPGCPTTTHIWVRRCRLGGTVGRYAFSSHQARAHAFSRPVARAHASCM